MIDRRKHLFRSRSARGAYFHEPERRSSEKSRSQKVKFRRRYANSVFKRAAVGLFKITATVSILAGLGYGGFYAWKFWQTSSTVRVSAVRFDGDIPPALETSFPIKANDHLFRVELEEVETALKQKFPELEELTVSRRLSRSLLVKGRYKKPTALCEVNGKQMGVFIDGTLFPIGEHNPPAEKLPLLAGKMDFATRAPLLRALETWKKEVPPFWTLVKRVETDNIGAVRVILEDGVVVQWGEMSESELLIDAVNILYVRERFTPTKLPALLRIVSKNRVVMNANWTEKKK